MIISPADPVGKKAAWLASMYNVAIEYEPIYSPLCNSEVQKFMKKPSAGPVKGVQGSLNS